MSQRRSNDDITDKQRRGGGDKKPNTTCKRIVCDNPVKEEYDPYCSITCQRLG